MIVGLTHMDCVGSWDMDNIAIALGFTDPNNRPPLICVNTTDQASVTNALIALLYQYLKECNSHNMTLGIKQAP